MSRQISQFEQFMLLFNQLQAAAGTPERLKTFYSESAALKRASDALELCLMSGNVAFTARISYTSTDAE